MLDASDTIFATSSGLPPAAIAIVRISGPAAFSIATALVGRLPEERRATLRAVRDPNDGSLLDRALVLVFPAPRTATGEDVVEFHVHGGRAVIAAVERVLAQFPDARRAEPGEFTRRALANGVIDLTGAEGLGDLLTAETETQRRAAVHMAEGGVRKLVEGWTSRLVTVAARVEAQLDFSDEDDVAEEAVQAVLTDIAALSGEIEQVLEHPPVERLREGIRVVIAGPPNAGKSTLLNAMAGRNVAIVSSISGTTRDRIEAPVVRGGIAYLLIDTAGLTAAPGDEIERIGVGLAESAIAGADMLLWLGDDEPPAHANLVNVHARADLPGRGVVPVGSDIGISASVASSVAALWNLVTTRAARLLPHDDVIATNHRQRVLLCECRAGLEAAMCSNDLLLIAEEVRVSLRALDAICGRSGVENVLDALFSTFCIGK